MRTVEEKHIWSVEKDVLDSAEFFHRVRNAFLSGDEEKLAEELKFAADAGVHFSDIKQLDISPAWRGKPSEAHILRKLKGLK